MNRPATSNALAPRGRASFTLIELLVVTTILGVLVGVIGACIASGIRVWDTARKFNTIEADAIVALEMMERDLRNTFPYGRIRFHGDARSVTMPGIVQGPEEQGSGLGTVGYSVDRGAGALVRTAGLYGGGEGLAETVARNVRQLDLEYYRIDRPKGQPPQWQQQRGAATNLPDKVMVRLTLDTDSGPVELSRAVIVPLGGQE